MFRLAHHWILAVTLCNLGCNSSPSLGSAESSARMEALIQSGASGKETEVPRILPSLASEDPLVRWTAQRSLLNLTGTCNGYDWAASRLDRQHAIEAWVQWCKDHGLAPHRVG